MIAFVHIHKTAGTTMMDVLRRSFGHRLYSSESGMPGEFSAADLRLLLRVNPHIECIAGHKIGMQSGLETVVQSLDYFTMLREPLIRTASHYLYKCSLRKQRGDRVPTLEEWLSDERQRNRQVQTLAGPGASWESATELLVQKQVLVGLLEEFDESLLMFRIWARCSSRIDIWHRPRNVRNNNLKQKLVEDRESRELLLEANQEDLRLYELAQREIFGEQRKNFGEGLQAARSELRRMPAARQLLPNSLPMGLASRVPKEIGTMSRYLSAVGLNRYVYRPAINWIRTRNSRAAVA